MIRIGTKSLWVTIVCLPVCALLLASCVGVRPRAQTATEPAIALEDCELASAAQQLNMRARCGTLAVPEDPENPAGRQIELHIVVVPAISRSPKPDPLFLLAGGPGQAATEAFPILIYTAFAKLRQDRDIVLVDQRGTGQSNPLQCDLPEKESAAETFSDQEIIAALQECPQTLDADLRYYTTEVAVQDLDQVRAALGYDQVNLYGASYGTRVALHYLHRYPAHVRTTVLDAVVSPNFYIFDHAGQDGTQALRLLFERCRADAGCQAAFPDLQAEFESLLRKLEQEPAEVRVPDPVSGELVPITMTRDRLASMVFALLYSPETVSLLPLDIHRAHTEGDYGPLLAQAASSDAGLYRGLLYSVACTEDTPFIDPEQAASRAVGTYFGDMSKSMRQVCEAWPRGQPPTELDLSALSRTPVLLLSGEADPITPPQYAYQVARALPNSLHLVAPGMGHGAIMRGCIPRIVADFVEAASVEELDTECVAQMVPSPFFVSFTGPQP